MGRSHSQEKSGNKPSVSGNRSAQILLLLAGLGGMALVLGAFQFLADRHAVRTTAEAYLAEVAAGRIDAAYDHTSLNFQVNQGLYSCRSSRKGSSALTTQFSCSLHQVYLVPTKEGLKGMVQATAHGRHGSQPLTLVLIKEDGAWKIDRWYDSWD